MATKEIPAALFYVCDSCGAERPGDGGRRPKMWSRLVLQRDAYDYSGCAVADGTVSRDLCGRCTERVAEAINAAVTVGQG